MLTFTAASLARVGVLGPEPTQPAALGQETPKLPSNKRQPAPPADNLRPKGRRRRRPESETESVAEGPLSKEDIEAIVQDRIKSRDKAKEQLRGLMERRPDLAGGGQFWKFAPKTFFKLGRTGTSVRMSAGFVRFSGEFAPEEMAELTRDVGRMWDEDISYRQWLERNIEAYDEEIASWAGELARVTGQTPKVVVEVEEFFERLCREHNLRRHEEAKARLDAYGPYRRSGWVVRWQIDDARGCRRHQAAVEALQQQLAAAEKLLKAVPKGEDAEENRLKAKIAKLKDALSKLKADGGETKDGVKLVNPEAKTIVEWVSKAGPLWDKQAQERLRNLRNAQLRADAPELAEAYREKILSAATAALLPDGVTQSLLLRVENGQLDPSRPEALTAAIQDAVEKTRVGWESRILGVNRAIWRVLQEVRKFKQEYAEKGGVEAKKAVATLRKILGELEGPRGIEQTLKEARETPAVFLRNGKGATMLVPNLPDEVTKFVKDDGQVASIATQIKQSAAWTEEETPMRKNDEVRPHRNSGVVFEAKATTGPALQKADPAESLAARW